MKEGQEFQKLIPFCKVDEAKREVWGIVTEEKKDRDGQTCQYKGTVPYYKAFSDEMSKATDGANLFPLRQMHQLSAAGKAIAVEYRDDAKQIYMGFKVVDDQAWQKCREFVYTGFSQGGRYVKVWKEDGEEWYISDPVEASLVDVPSLPTATFEYVKADGSVSLMKFADVHLQPDSPKKKSVYSNSVNFILGISDTKSEVQSVLFDKSQWSAKDAQAWLKSQSFTGLVCDEAGDNFRFHQTDPNSYTEFRTITPGERKAAMEVDMGLQLSKKLDVVASGVAAVLSKAEAKTKRVAGEDLPSSAFLIVGDPDDTSTWKLPVEFSSKSKTKSHLRNALARFNQLKDVSESQKKSAWTKLKRLCRENGIEVTDGEKAGKAKQVELAKSLYTVGNFASLLEQINYMRTSCEWEGDYEGGDEDDYAIAEDIREWLETGADLFLEMAEHEVAELTADAAQKAAKGETRMNNDELQKKSAASLSNHFKKAAAFHDKLAECHKAHAEEHMDMHEVHKTAGEVDGADKPFHKAKAAFHKSKAGLHEKTAKAYEAMCEHCTKMAEGYEAGEHKPEGGNPEAEKAAAAAELKKAEEAAALKKAADDAAAKAAAASVIPPPPPELAKALESAMAPLLAKLDAQAAEIKALQDKPAPTPVGLTLVPRLTKSASTGTDGPTATDDSSGL